MGLFGRKKKMLPITLDDGSIIEAEVISLAPEEVVEEVKTEELVEVTDGETKARLLSTLPTLAKNGGGALKSGTLYRVKIPAGTSLAPSRSLKGAFRGLVMGSKGVVRQANLVPVKVPLAVSAAGAAYAVASFLVGQHYMHEVSSRLDLMREEVDHVLLFQRSEFQSKVRTIALQVASISSHRKEILKNKELRLRELSNLDRYEFEASVLLGQCSASLSSLSTKEEKTYEVYVSDAVNASAYTQSAVVLVETLKHIVELKYLLNLGKVTPEYCLGQLPLRVKEASDSLNALSAFHDRTLLRLGVDLEQGVHPKENIFRKITRKMPLTKDAKGNFIPMEDSTIKLIRAEQGLSLYLPSPSPVYDEDVEVYIRDESFYLKKPS